jgi:ABC-type phosphate transport system permease subunit
MFWLFVWLPALVTASLLAVVVTTGEGAVVLALGLVFTMASFWAWRTYERARRTRFQLPGRKRRRR